MSFFDIGLVLFYFKFLLTIFFLAFAFQPEMSHATEALTFTHKDSLQKGRAAKLLSHYDFEQFAAVDLNNDSIDEYILKTTKDEAFEVLALGDDKLISLGVINARKLMVSDSRTNGVRSLFGFSDPNNDFEYDIYTWDAMNSSFVLATKLDQKGGLK